MPVNFRKMYRFLRWQILNLRYMIHKIVRYAVKGLKRTNQEVAVTDFFLSFI